MTLELPQDVEPQNVAPPVTFGNFAMPSGSYIPPKWQVRAGSEQFLNLESKGMPT